MTKWMDNAIKRIKEADETRQLKEAAQLHRARIIDAKSEGFFEDLCSVLEQSVNTFNQTFSNDSERKLTFARANAPGTVFVSRMYYPRVKVTISLEKAQRVIECLYEIRKNQESSTKEKKTKLQFDIDTSDNLYITHDNELKDTDDASGIILEPVLFPPA